VTSLSIIHLSAGQPVEVIYVRADAPLSVFDLLVIGIYPNAALLAKVIYLRSDLLDSVINMSGNRSISVSDLLIIVICRSTDHLLEAVRSSLYIYAYLLAEVIYLSVDLGITLGPLEAWPCQFHTCTIRLGLFS
jgi:hypothetical protein